MTLAALAISLVLGQDWLQHKGDARRSGDVPDRALALPLGLVAALPMTDGLYASPAVADGTVYVVDGAGRVAAFDVATLRPKWTVALASVNNVASPAVIGPYLHVSTTRGLHYVLDRATGRIAKEIDAREPIFSAAAVGNGRVYVATLGSRVYALEPDGAIAWTWDFVKEVVGFDGDRWSGADWLRHKKDRVDWKDHFVCSRDLALHGKTLVIPAGGRTVFLDDAGDRPALRRVAEIPAYDGKEFPATFGQSLGPDGEAYVQWHRRDNAGRVEILKPDGTTDIVKGTQTAIHLPGLLSFASVSMRGTDVYRVRPEEGLGLVRHAGDAKPVALGAAPSICPPILTKEHAVYGGLDHRLHVVPLAGGPGWSFEGRAPFTAAPAVVDGRVYAPCEDGYLYVFGPDGKAAPPEKDLEVWKIRSPLTGPLAGPEHDWYTNYGDFGCTNANVQGLKPPLRMRWARRVDGTVKHLPVCGGGRLYTHTAEGEISAVEQDTGRLLWRRHFPDVYLSFTSPLYYKEKLIVPQAGMKKSRMRCLDAATGKLLWEAPFTGSPSWSRQFPPVVHGDVAIYASGSGRYAAQGTEKPFTFKGAPEKADGEVMAWIYSNDNPFYPKDNKPLLWGWDLNTGKIVWEKDFSEFGRGGNDCGICVLDGKLYYSTFFGYSKTERAARGLPADNNGLTACLDPATGKVLWTTTKHHVTAKCTITGRDGRLYLGGNNPAEEGVKDRYVWCLDAKDGSLVWRSDPVTSALNVITVGDRFVFSNALRGKGNVFDRATGKVVASVGHNYACCRFTMSGDYILGANMDLIDLADGGKMVSTGPAIDSRECLGAVVSNGRVFYTSQASGFQVSQTCGGTPPPLWEIR
ncbi:MAG TPA: PQQ-binding-like beta-propeller repeat protein [Planctomycetota bacterium]